MHDLRPGLRAGRRGQGRRQAAARRAPSWPEETRTYIITTFALNCYNLFVG